MFSSSGLTVALLIHLMLSGLAGIAVGLLAPARQALASFYAQAALFLPASAIGALFLTLSSMGGFPSDLWTLLCLQPLLWMPVGSAAAAVAGLLRNGLPQRPARWVLW